MKTIYIFIKTKYILNIFVHNKYKIFIQNKKLYVRKKYIYT